MRQKLIRNSITLWFNTHPGEKENLDKHIREVRGSRAKPVALNDTIDAQWAFSLPSGLMTMLNTLLVEPTFLKEDKEYKWFFENFPQFRVANRTER